MPKKTKRRRTQTTRTKSKKGNFDLDPVLDPGFRSRPEHYTTLHLFQYEEKVGNLALLLKRQGLRKSLSFFVSLW